MDKERDEILKLYTDYFKEDLDAINEELETSKKYSTIIDKEIHALSSSGIPSKGSQHYLIEHITNAVQLQTQREGLRKDKVNIKKIIMDYSNKQLDKSSNLSTESNMIEVINKLINQEKEIPQKLKITSDNPDEEIDKILEETKEEE